MRPESIKTIETLAAHQVMQHPEAGPSQRVIEGEWRLTMFWWTDHPDQLQQHTTILFDCLSHLSCVVHALRSSSSLLPIWM